MNTTINVSNPLDTIQIIVRYDENNNQVHKISFFYEDELQLIISQDSFDVTLGDKIPPKHITAAKEFMRTCNAPGANIIPTKTLYDIISHNCMMTELLVHTHKPDFKWDCASPYMYDYVQYQDIIKSEANFNYQYDSNFHPAYPDNINVVQESMQTGNHSTEFSAVERQEHLRALFACVYKEE